MIRQLGPEHQDYLRDESRRSGFADSISFATTEAEVASTIREVAAARGTITTQGARTGIVGGAVPQGGHILNLSRMKGIGSISRDSDGARLVVQPGVLLSEIQETAAAAGFIFPPDPTETSASIGGMIACNASGAATLAYGPTRCWIRAIRVVIADGDVIALRRGERRANGRQFALTTTGGRTICGELPGYSVPAVKSAAGYYVADDMDLIDLFIGSEGTLGIITEAELEVLPAPAADNGLSVFLPDQAAALALVRALRSESMLVRPVAIEFFNADALNLLRRMKSESAAFEKIPALKDHYHTAIYTEFRGNSSDEIEETVLQLMETAAELGGSDEDTWFATSPRELEPIKAFRHAVPEAVNLLIDQRRRTSPDIIKLGTDMSVPDEHLETVIGIYDSDLAASGLESVIFGHIGNNHVHVNILPRSQEEYARGREMYLGWARKVIELGGSVSAEHGIGKIKAPFLELMYGAEGVREMRELKALFDPRGMLNPGNLF